MKTLAEIFYDAITSDEYLMATIGGRVVSTCFEVPPDAEENTPVPNIIIIDDGFQNQQTTKDCLWEASEDRIQVSVEIAAASPQDVKAIVRKVRKAIENYIGTMFSNGQAIPELEILSSDGIAWDWMNPAYYQRLSYQCITNADIDDGQENI